jgi:hypothetical protein
MQQAKTLYLRKMQVQKREGVKMLENKKAQ